VIILNIREMRLSLGDTQSEFARRYDIPFRTVQNWETGTRKPPEYIIRWLEKNIKNDMLNRRTTELPKYSHKKYNLPKRSEFVGATAWLKAVSKCIGEPIVFALDEALMCQGNFGGRSDEYLIWIYGNDSAARFNGVVVLGNEISSEYTEKKNGIVFTNFNRTLFDAFSNESILDMQGITEALSKYYYRNGESFDGVFVTPEYQKKFKKLAEEAVNYYES